jgi:hypothetical protein
VFAAFCLAGAAMAADKTLDVRDLMTATQFHQTGLDKLTPDELAAFNAWLAAYGHAPAAQATPVPAAVATTTPVPAAATGTQARFGQEMLTPEQRGEPKVIETRIPGSFTGWSGNTVFTLENGQVWQQSAPGEFETHLQDPKVVIKKLGFGYLLTIPGQGATVFVKRIR